MRTLGLPASLGAPLFLFRDDTPLEAHAAYAAAKSSDPAATVGFVMDLAEPLARQVKVAIPFNVIFVAPHVREAPGDNAIPQVPARACRAAGAEADRDIVLRTCVFGANRLPASARNPCFPSTRHTPDVGPHTRLKTAPPETAPPPPG
jgi:hypothetical protein